MWKLFICCRIQLKFHLRVRQKPSNDRCDFELDRARSKNTIAKNAFALGHETLYSTENKYCFYIFKLWGITVTLKYLTTLQLSSLDFIQEPETHIHSIPLLGYILNRKIQDSNAPHLKSEQGARTLGQNSFLNIMWDTLS